jgi:hypothetical protein
MGRDAGTAPFTVVAQAVILADDLVAFDMAHAQRDATMKTDVSRRGQGAIRKTVNHNPLIQQTRRLGLVCDGVGEGDWIPERCERPPIALGESTSAWQAGSAGCIGSKQLRGGNKGIGSRHGSL